MIRGINHVTLSVCELEPSLRFYVELLGCRLLARWPRGAYLLAGKLWLALIVDDKGRKQALPEYTHFALDVEPAGFDVLCERIRGAGAKIWQKNTSEGDSLYFLDPDGHKLELHVGDLKTRLAQAATLPWPGLEVLVDAKELELLL